MSFKFSSVANFFSRPSRSVQSDEKNSASQFNTLHSRKTRKTDSKFSSSKIVSFLDRLFHSKKKAQQSVDTAIKSNTIKNPGSLNVKKSSNVCADLSIDDIIANTPGHIKTPGTLSSAPEASYAELDQRRDFIDSNEGRFMLDIVSMGTCIEKPQQHFRALPGLDLQKTLANAFQIYYEEGKLIHEESFATPGWGFEPTAQSTTDLKNLKANLGTISAQRENEQALIQKAIGAIEVRVDRIIRSGEK